jgi:hypothetical protein
MGYRDWTAVYSGARLDATHNPQSLLLIASAESPQVAADQPGCAGPGRSRSRDVARIPVEPVQKATKW